MARHALIVGVSGYANGLSKLPGSAQDVEAIAKVLGDPALGAYAITKLHDPSTAKLSEAIETFYRERRRDDVLVFYFSGHGLKDERGELYFATPETEKYDSGSLRRTSAVPGKLLQECMHGSVSKCQVVILDCCFSGAFARGMLAKDGAELDFRELGSDGHAVLTSSTSVQYSFQVGETSVYTQSLVEGIASGAADEDGDGRISVDELHQFAKNRVREQYPNMRPGIFSTGEGYGITLCQAPLTLLKQFERDVRRLLDAQGGLPVTELPRVEALRAKYRVSCAEQEDVFQRLQAPFLAIRERSTSPVEGLVDPRRDHRPYLAAASVAALSIVAMSLALGLQSPSTVTKLTTAVRKFTLPSLALAPVPTPQFTPGRDVAERDRLTLMGMRLLAGSEKLTGFLSPDMDVMRSAYFFTGRRLAAAPSNGQPGVSVPFEQVSGIEEQAEGGKTNVKIQTRSAPIAFTLPLDAGRDFAAALRGALKQFRESHVASAILPPIKVTELALQTPKPAEPAIPFDSGAAERSLGEAAAKAHGCSPAIGVPSEHTVVVSFTPNGKASSAVFLDPSFGVVPGASCVLRLFRNVTVPPFTGGAVTLRSRFTLD